MRMCVVTEDRGPLQMAAPIAQQALKDAWAVEYVTAGVSKGEAQSGYSVPESDFIYPADVIAHNRPDVIVVGCSSPISIEQTFADAAKKYEIPLVILGDIRGSFKRIQRIERALVLVADEQDRQLAVDDGFKTAVVGLREAVPPPISLETAELFETIRGDIGRVVHFAASGQPKRIAQELECVLESSRLTTIPHFISFQPNQKIISQMHPRGGTWGDWLKRAIDGRADWIAGPCVRYADATISPSVSALSAACMGKIGIGLRCAAVEDVLASEPGVIDQLEKYEREYGLPIIREPLDLSPLLTRRTPVHVKAFDPSLALQSIVSYIHDFSL